MAPRMAADDAAEGQPAATQAAMRFQRFDCIRRTAGREAAVISQPGADEITIEADGSDEQLADHRRLRSSRVSISSRTRAWCSRSQQGPKRPRRRNTNTRE